MELPARLNAFPISYLQLYSRNESLSLLSTTNPEINYSANRTANRNYRFPINRMAPRATFLRSSSFSAMLYDQKPLESDV